MKRNYVFKNAYDRLLLAFGIATQYQVAEVLEVSQGAINNCVRRKTFPDGWLVTLYLKYHLNPRWVLWGDEHKMWLIPTDNEPEESGNVYIQGSGGKD